MTRLYPDGPPFADASASPCRHLYFAKRVGLWWEVWRAYEDDHAGPSGLREWPAVLGVRFWRSVTALRVADEMRTAHIEGTYAPEFPRRPAAPPARGAGT